MTIHCCEVFADVNTIYFTALWWIMNDGDWFETLKTQLLDKHIWILLLLWKWIKYTLVLYVLICIKKMPGVGVLLWNQLELLYSLRKEIGVGPLGLPSHKSFIIDLSKFFFKSKGCRIWYKFNLSIGRALVLFCFFNNKQKMYGGPCTPLVPLQNSYISIYFGHKTLFLPNNMIIITGTFRNSSNYVKERKLFF